MGRSIADWRRAQVCLVGADRAWPAGDAHLDLRRPESLRLELNAVAQSGLVDLRRGRADDARLEAEHFALVRQGQLSVPVDLTGDGSTLLHILVLDLEKVGKVGLGLDADVE